MSWITDRLPTEEDAYKGDVQVPPRPFILMNFIGGPSYLYTKSWRQIEPGEPWYTHPMAIGN